MEEEKAKDERRRWRWVAWCDMLVKAEDLRGSGNFVGRKMGFDFCLLEGGMGSWQVLFCYQCRSGGGRGLAGYGEIVMTGLLFRGRTRW